MNSIEYSKLEIATFLSDFDKVMTYATVHPSATLDPSKYAFTVGGPGYVDVMAVNEERAVRPTLYLDASLTATGSGSKLDPYVLN